MPCSQVLQDKDIFHKPLAVGAYTGLNQHSCKTGNVLLYLIHNGWHRDCLSSVWCYKDYVFTLAPRSPSLLISNILVAQLFGVLGSIYVMSEAPETKLLWSLLWRHLWRWTMSIYTDFRHAAFQKNIPFRVSEKVAFNLKKAEQSLRYKHYSYWGNSDKK